MPNDTLVVSMDYAAAIDLAPWEELQSQSMQGHSHLQMLVVCTWRRAQPGLELDAAAGEGEGDEEREIIHEQHFFLYDRKGTKNTFKAAEYALQKLNEHWAGTGISRIVVCSDNYLCSLVQEQSALLQHGQAGCVVEGRHASRVDLRRA